MPKSSLCYNDYSDTYILAKGTITMSRSRCSNKSRGKGNKQETFKKRTLFMNCNSQTNDTKVDNAEYLDTVMPIYNLIEYSDNHAKIIRKLTAVS